MKKEKGIVAIKMIVGNLREKWGERKGFPGNSGDREDDRTLINIL